jgi:hypothetical protein
MLICALRSLNARLAAAAAAKKRRGPEDVEILDPLMIAIENDVRKRLELQHNFVDATEVYHIILFLTRDQPRFPHRRICVVTCIQRWISGGPIFNWIPHRHIIPFP